MKRKEANPMTWYMRYQEDRAMRARLDDIIHKQKKAAVIDWILTIAMCIGIIIMFCGGCMVSGDLYAEGVVVMLIGMAALIVAGLLQKRGG